MTNAWWRTGATDPATDTHVAFRGTFEMARAGPVELGILASGWFVAYMDGVDVAQGPDRFVPADPECSMLGLSLGAGAHVLGVHVHHHGVDTEHALSQPPFLRAEVIDAAGPLTISWRAAALDGYRSQVRRLNPNLAWIEWCDTRRLPADWQRPGHDDRHWLPAEPAFPVLGPVRSSTIGPVRARPIAATLVSSGTYAERFGALADDPTVCFAARELDPHELPVDGAYFCFDLGRTTLGRPKVVLDVPVGTSVEIAYGEGLHGGRVLPVTSWANGPSCMLDHYTARGGRQELGPMAPRGCRYVEVHVRAPVAAVELTFVERGYFDDPAGSFSCPDDRLNRIWTTSLATLRACAEDAIVDCPTRERGQWLGDSTVVGLELAAVGYSDLRLVRRALVQSAQCANDDGFVAATAPGTSYYLASYSAQWFTAAVRYVEHTGDLSILRLLLAHARRNATAFLCSMRADGRLSDDVPWPFIDWGAARQPPSANLALHLHLLEGALAFQRWGALLGVPIAEADDLEVVVSSTVRQWLREADEGALGYHATVLALRAGLLLEVRGAVESIKDHLGGCFPNDPLGPRLASPATEDTRIITPYFAHFSLAALVEWGETPFVLDQYRRCWGWFLDQGFTTWPEVFDTRWSHCHHWSGAPGWQLSRYLLGLNPRFDIARRVYELQVHTGGLNCAEGMLPVNGEDAVIRVRWNREPGGLHYELEAPVAITLLLPSGESVEVAADDRWSGVLTDADASRRTS